MSNTLGTLFKITSFGESHGTGIGVTIDGCPADIPIDINFIQSELDRRKPGQSRITTQRKETDTFTVFSGIFQGKTTGSPITLLIHNADQKSKDYDHIKDIFRPSHADFTYKKKYGVYDHRGGGRSSARVTAGWVAAGAIAKMVIKELGITCQAYVTQVGTLKLDKSYHELDLSKTETNLVRCPDEKMALRMIDLIDKTRKERETIGGVICGVITGVPIGLGEPLFNKLNASLGHAMLSINAVKGFEYGSGFRGSEMKGSQHNDIFKQSEGQVSTITNHSGGIQGGISNGQDIYYNVAFKPVATIMQDQTTIDDNGKEVIIKGKGRHDPCVLPRAVPIVESMSAIVMADSCLMAQANTLQK